MYHLQKILTVHQKRCVDLNLSSWGISGASVDTAIGRFGIGDEKGILLSDDLETTLDGRRKISRPKLLQCYFRLWITNS